MGVKRFLTLFFIFIFIPIVQAQAIVVPDWIRTASGLWIVFLFVAFIFIAVAYIIKGKTGKFILIGGIISLFLSIIFVLISVVLPLFTQQLVTYEKCVEMFKPDIPILTFPGISYAASCILTGYAPTGLEWLTITSFIIFGIISPLALLITLFFEFIPEELITGKHARRIIAFVGALFAFRGFLATYFIEMLSYGFVGIGALTVAVLFTGIVWKAACRFVMPLGVSMTKELQYFTLAEAEQIRREISKLQEAYSIAPEPMKVGILERINTLTQRLKKLEEQGT